MRFSHIYFGCWCHVHAASHVGGPDEQWDDVLLLQQFIVSSGAQRSARVASGPGVLRERVSGDGAGQEDVLAHDGTHGFGFGDEPGLDAVLRLCRKTRTMSRTETATFLQSRASCWWMILQRSETATVLHIYTVRKDGKSQKKRWITLQGHMSANIPDNKPISDSDNIFLF